MRSFLKRPGNKTKHLRFLLPQVPPFHTYIEPFVGTGALFLRLQPNTWIINDLNQDVIQAWKMVLHSSQKITNSFTVFKQHFMTLSDADKLDRCRDLTDRLNHIPASDALRTILFLLMTYCVYMGTLHRKGLFYFNGLDLQLTVRNRVCCLEPWYYENLQRVHSFLASTRGHIMNGDYKRVLQRAKKGDFVFLDPPYCEKDYNFQYNTNESIHDGLLHELYEQVQLLDQRGVHWLMTQADTPLVRQIFQRYTLESFPVYRRFRNHYETELIIRNYSLS